MLELNVPIIIGLNMMDVAIQHGLKINYDTLMRKLKVPIFPIVARKAKGTNTLLHELKKLSNDLAQLSRKKSRIQMNVYVL